MTHRRTAIVFCAAALLFAVVLFGATDPGVRSNAVMFGLVCVVVALGNMAASVIAREP